MAPLALRALGAIALPGAFLAVVAPAASATEVAPLSDINGSNATKSTDDNAAAGGTSALPDSSELLSGQNFSF